MEALTLPLDAFVRSVGVNQGSAHAFFLGAGASMSSGIPTAGRCIWEWKRNIFLTNNPGLEGEFSELSLPSIQERIQQWLEAKNYLPLDDPREYSDYILRCFPIAEHRRRYFQGLVQKAKPHVGYKFLCLLARADIIRAIWTTNFDGLTARTAAAFELTPIEVGIDCRERVVRQSTRGEILCVSLHGEYRYDELKNTEQELQRQDAQLRSALIADLEHTNLIVCGYSGRDPSVMEALTQAYSKAGPGALYWCGHGNGDPPPVVLSLLKMARENKRIAYYVPGQGFDDLLIRLGLHCLTGDLLKQAQAIAAEETPAPLAQWAPFTVNEGPLCGVVKSNCFPIQCPTDVLTFEVSGLPDTGVWRHLRDATDGRDVVAVPFKRKVLALGTVDGVRDLFGDRVRGMIDRTPVDQKELRYEDGAIVHLLLKSLLKCFEKKLGLKTEGKRLVWDPNSNQEKVISGKDCLMCQSAILSLRMIADRQYLVIKPSVVFTDKNGRLLPEEEIRAEKLKVLGYQHNKEFNDALKHWSNLLLPQTGEALEFPANCGSTFRFKIGRSPLVSKIMDASQQYAKKLKPEKARLINQSGIQLKEPELVFARRTEEPGWSHDAHPIRGILNNRPYDFSLTRRGLADRVSLGVVCPATENRMFDSYLRGLLQSHDPRTTESEYLLPFPGFPTAFGLPIHIPRPGEQGWIDCPEPASSLGAREGTIELARTIKTCVDSVRASAAPNVVVMCIPERWAQWRKFETETERMDLHDFVKAYCVHKGIS